MKKIFFLFALTCFSTIGFSQGFIVDTFSVDIYLHKEGYFDVVERYNVNFTEAKHGIYRDILTDYSVRTQDGNTEKRNLVLRNIEVLGHPMQLNTKLEQRTVGKVSIKIGDKDKLVTGGQYYEIRYTVYNAFLFDDEWVQFYWNLKPGDWNTIFKKINFRIYAPDGTPLSAENCFLYTGVTGVAEPTSEFDLYNQDHMFSGTSKEGFFSTIGENVTVWMKLPRISISENYITVSLWRQYSWTGILAALLFGFWLLWRKYGKDAAVVAVTSYYPPQGIDPAMAGYLMDDQSNSIDLIAFLPHWAANGYITIEEIAKEGWLGSADIRLTRLKDLPKQVSNYEQTLFQDLFGVFGDVILVSGLKHTFYKTMIRTKKMLKDAAQIYYENESRKVMLIAMIGAIVLGILLSVWFLFYYGVLAAVCAPLVCVFIAFMSFYLQKKNQRGHVLFSELKGFRQFIKLAELNRIKTLISEDPHYFEKTMSYALAFGLLDKWASKFSELDIPPPEWYASTGSRVAGMNAFSKSFGNTIRIAQNNMVSAPSSSSSSGGTSGGGFGGGGGGSW